MDEYLAFADHLHRHGMSHPRGSNERNNQVRAAEIIRELCEGTVEVVVPIVDEAAFGQMLVIAVADDESVAQAVARHFGCKLMPWQRPFFNGERGPTSVTEN